MQFNFINATEAHLPVVHKLAHSIWPAAFKNILAEEQITYMLEWMYSIPSLKQQMRAGHHFLLVKKEKYYGYCSYQHMDRMTKLHKLYILPEMQGRGIGSALLSEVIKRAKEKGHAALQLNVNRFNKAVAFYQKSGFLVLRKEDHSIGNGFFMNDYVMELPL